ncbi:uncharacterized protein LOC129003525 [Macrosteles quadrilineatus]|uniref:uncharacterized protein LOC129003525 n=1 Tax=Macrosteles quadrilineatus TaxID=74068 RepID=UPI0023E33956|nr:uncharacterized protein LOC129003525 [Macrosteles quadrilineatus]
MGLDTGAGPVNYSVLTAPGPVWKPIRKMMNAMFSPRNLNLMMPVYNKHSRYLINRLSTEVGNGPTKVNMMEYINDAAFMIINDFVFGHDNNIDVHSEEFKALVKTEERITILFMNRFIKPWLRWQPLFELFNKKEITTINKFLSTFLEKQLKDSQKHHELKLNTSTVIKNDNDDKNSNDGFLSLLDVYRPFQERNPLFTEADMRAEICILYATDKLYEEITSVVGPDDDVTTDDIRQMIYLDQCFQEALRRDTLVPLIIRKTSEEIKLSMFCAS